ncbi:MAG: SAM-dependent methyltransferase [Bacilli bacterium]|nr:SAM-dependent methyltransferase [Bacilli bacterium]
MLNLRLRHIAKLVEPCEVLIDIGSDHGFLPLHLLQESIIKHAVICDINALPLQSAIKNARKIKLEEHCTFVQSNGLQAYQGQVNSAVIAGMGFETITQIIKQDLERFKSIDQIILQSNTHIEKLRAFLMDNKFKIVDEELVKDRKHFYVIVKVKYQEHDITYDDFDRWIGPILKLRSDMLMQQYLVHLKRIETNVLSGQKKESSLKIQVIQTCLDVIQTS